MAPVALSLVPEPPPRRLWFCKADAAAIAQHWAFLKQGIAKCKTYQPKDTFYEPEHVKAQVLSGHAELWLAFTQVGAPTLEGFVITTTIFDPFISVPVGMFLWFGYGLPGHKGMEEGLEHVEDVARERGCRFLETLTPRRGLVRKYERRGWRLVNYQMRLELED